MPSIATDSHAEMPRDRPSGLGWLLALSCPLLLVLAAAINPLDQSDATPAGTAGAGLNVEVALKLLLTGTVGVVALVGGVLCPSARARLTRLPGALLVALGVVFIATSVFAYGPAANVSRVAAMISCVYIVFIAVSLNFLTIRQTVLCVLCGLTLHMLAAWAIHLTGGENVTFQEELAGSVIVDRMGSTAHPNSLGRMGALAVLLCVGCWRMPSRRVSPFAALILMGVVVLAVATMVESMSRTAMAACGASLMAMMWDRLANRRGLALGLLATVLLCGVLIGAGLFNQGAEIGNRVVSAGTKTGDVSELTSATGRTVIWAEAIRLIAQRPLTGWGLNSAPLLLEDFSHHTHNVLLHALFSAGMFAGICVALLLTWTVFRAATVVDPLFRGVAAYVCVSGLFEDTVFETFPFSSTLLWLIVLLASTPRRQFNEHDDSMDEAVMEEESILQPLPVDPPKELAWT